MTPLSAYHFPETDLTLAAVSRQLLFFDTLHYLTATEQEQADASGLCIPYAPAPLGDDLPRFQQLLAELKGNEAAFYQGQLSTMALDYLENRDPETVLDIISNLQGSAPAPAKETKNSGRDEELWQARLLLKLAEMLRQEQQELAQGLAAMNDRQADLLKELKGEEELQDLYGALQDSSTPQFPIRVEPLIRAWGHLLLAGDRAPWCLHCFSEEEAEAFFEANESACNQRPARLLRLPLPAAEADNDDYQDKRQQWLSVVADCRQPMASKLSEIAKQGTSATSLAELSQLAGQWTKAYAQDNPWPEPAPVADATKNCVTPHLEIYLLNQPITSLVARLCGDREHQATDQWSHGLLALFSSRSSSCQG